jgi:hypothetical protein
MVSHLLIPGATTTMDGSPICTPHCPATLQQRCPKLSVPLPIASSRTASLPHSYQISASALRQPTPQGYSSCSSSWLSNTTTSLNTHSVNCPFLSPMPYPKLLPALKQPLRTKKSSPPSSIPSLACQMSRALNAGTIAKHGSRLLQVSSPGSPLCALTYLSIRRI